MPSETRACCKQQRGAIKAVSKATIARNNSTTQTISLKWGFRRQRTLNKKETATLARQSPWVWQTAYFSMIAYCQMSSPVLIISTLETYGLSMYGLV